VQGVTVYEIIDTDNDQYSFMALSSNFHSNNNLIVDILWTPVTAVYNTL
jgi:hypothetical protein